MLIYVFARAVSFFVEVVVMMIVVEAIMSWFVRPGNGAYRFYLTLEGLTEPIIRPFRQLTQGIALRTGMDFAPVVAIFALYLIEKVVIRVLFLFAN